MKTIRLVTVIFLKLTNLMRIGAIIKMTLFFAALKFGVMINVVLSFLWTILVIRIC